MPSTQTYAPHQPIFLLFRDQSSESVPPSLLHHVDQGDYFGTLATVLNFVRGALIDDMYDPSNRTMGKARSITVLDGMKDDLIHLQNNYDVIKKTKNSASPLLNKKDPQ
jgi:hypothetical protein